MTTSSTGPPTPQLGRGPPRTNIPLAHTPGPAGGLAPLRPAATPQSRPSRQRPLGTRSHFGTRFIPLQVKAPPRINPGWVSGIRGERCVTCRPDYDGLADVSPVTPLLPTRISLSGPDGATQSPLQPVPLECSRSQSVRRIGYIVATTTKASLPQPQRQALADCRTLEGSASRQEHDPTCPVAPTRTHRAETPGGTLSLTITATTKKTRPPSKSSRRTYFQSNVISHQQTTSAIYRIFFPCI